MKVFDLFHSPLHYPLALFHCKKKKIYIYIYILSFIIFFIYYNYNYFKRLYIYYRRVQRINFVIYLTNIIQHHMLNKGVGLLKI